MIVDPVSTPVPADDSRALRELVTECVRGGASIGFVEPVSDAEIEAYFGKLVGDMAGGHRVVLAAREGPGRPLLGAAQLALETKANGRHRAEVQKLMVFSNHRRRGIGAALMGAVETSARERGIKLLYLDTSEGRGGACDFYRALGYRYAGGIPGFAVDPNGEPSKNAIFYKILT